MLTAREIEVTDKLLPLVVALLRVNIELIPFFEVMVEMREQEPRGLGTAVQAAKVLEILKEMGKLQEENPDVIGRTH